MKKWLVLTIVLAAMPPAVGSVSAHHGLGATYDNQKRNTMTGVVTELAWRNPHVSLFIDVKDESGKVTNWALESANVSTLSRGGWARTKFRPGTPVTVVVNPARSGAPVALLLTVALPDGTKLRGIGGGAGVTEEERRIR
jgi:hypothetical protein